MKKIILLMSFIVLTTIAHAFNYGSITIYQDGEWGAPFYIKTSVVYIVFNQTIVKRLRGVFGLFTLGERTVWGNERLTLTHRFAKVYMG